MLLLDQQRQLIEKFVKSNAKYSGNEDLFEDFCNEAFQKSYIIFNSSSSVQKIESYVSKVVNTSILAVLKDNGRVRKTSKGYVSTNEVSLNHVPRQTVQQSQTASFVSSEYLQSAVDFDFEDPRESVEEIVIKKDLLQRIADVVCVVHKDSPQKCFLDLFYLRYVKNCAQSEISKELNLSQSEISKRLLELSKLIKAHLNS